MPYSAPLSCYFIPHNHKSEKNCRDNKKYFVQKQMISKNWKYLIITDKNKCLYFELEQARGKISMKRRVPCRGSNFTRYKCSLNKVIC